MECAACTQEPVIVRPPRCKEHFFMDFEARVAQTIEEHGLLTTADRVCVAASGGKDSLTTLYLLRKFGYDVTALLIDEGIAGYRERTIVDLKGFCAEHGIPYRIVSFKEAYGKELDEMLADGKLHPCTVCGTFRRTLLNKHAAGYDALATGHNADDEAQAVLMNLVRANTTLFPRGGPVTTSNAEGFVRRVKPLYFCTEKEVMTYALLNGISSGFTECPNVTRALRATVRDALNAYEAAHPGAKRRVLARYLALKGRLLPQTSAGIPCRSCGEPSQDGRCKACRLQEKIVTI